MKRISTLSQTWGVRALVALGILSVLAPISGAGNLLSGFLPAAKHSGPVRTEVASAAKKTNADDTRRSAPMEATKPPAVKQAVETARRDVVCSLLIDNVSIGECRNDVETGFQSKVLVAVFVSWVDPPVGQNIEITVDGVTKTINPAEKGCANYVQFILDADGSSQVADAQFSGGTCSAPSVIFNLPAACAGSAPCAGATSIGGRVYSDFDSDGTLDASEFGLGGAQIDLFDNNENLLCTATTDLQGEWTCAGLTAGQAVRVEVSNFPSGYTPAGTGIDNNGGVVQFATVGSDCTVDFGLLDAGHYCENNPYVITPCYVRGDPQGGGTSGLMDVLVAVPYNASGNTSVNSYLALNNEAGSMWGVAYQKETKKLFTSAFLKRHCGWGPAGLGGIYVTDVSTIPAPGVSNTGLISTYFNLDAYGINTGNEASLTRNLGPNVNQPTYDGQVFDLVGKWGLGDIDITEDGDSLFIVNMFNRSLVTVAIGNPAVTPVPASAVSEVTIPDPGCSNASDWRPFALKYNNGKIYVGGVCSAQTSQDADDLQAIIYEYSPAAGTFTEILNIPLGYDKGFVLTGLSHCENWNPWTNDFNDLPAGGIELCYPQPILSDIEFDVYGNMMVAFNDRGGHQMGWYDYGTTPPSTQTWKGNSGGDVLRVVNNNGTWLIERNATAGYDDGCGAGNGQGPCGGEFYCQDSYLSAHQEAVHGGIAVHPSNNELLLNMMDATSAFSGGLAWYNNASGIKNRAYRVYFSDNNGDNGTNGKAAGLGDVEILCGEAPIEIGNYVWADTDRDGIMDPGEPGLFGVNVALYKGGNLIATTTTNILGQYKFGGANVLPNMAYCVAFGTGGQFSNGTLSIGGASYAMTLSNIGFGANADNNDSDVNPGGNTLPVAIQGLPVVCLVTGNYGDNNNTLDAGFFPVIDYGDLPDNNTAGAYPTDATNGAGEGVGPSHQIIPTLKMGASVDFEDGGQPSVLANGDDTNGTPDDENGVTLPMFVAGQSVNVPVVVMNMTGSVAKLTGFFDWNKNGNLLDAGEMFSLNVPNGTNGTVNLPVVVPAAATLNMDLGVRFRLSTNATVSMLPTGAAPDGEVEDYLVQVMAFDFGDLPDNNTAGSYPTDGTDGAGEGIGASHKINGTLKLGASVDFENGGQPSALANGDDTNGTDDENGIAAFPTLTAGQPATLTVNAMNMSGSAAVLFVYFDWNKDGDFNEPNETVNVPVPDGTNGNISIPVTVPLTTTTNMNLGVRLRLSNDVLAAGTPSGPAPNGEVEDYVVQVLCQTIELTTVVDHPNCFGSTDGSINLTVTGGTGNYTYDWSNDGPETPDNDPMDLINIGAGNYSVTVTDQNGCDEVTSVVVNQPTVLVPTTAVTNVSCNGGADGAIDLGVSGGTLPYVYDWSNDGPESPDTDNQDLAGLTAGTYTVTITDINGCVTTTGATLSEPATGLNLTASQMNVSCNAGANGSINLTVSGGTSPYTYDWSNDGEEDPDNDSQDISGLAAGLYSVTVTDDNGCSDILNVTITEPSPVQLSTAIMDVPCTSGNNGGIVLTVTGGTPGYSYDWSNDGPDSPDNDPKDLTNVPAGTYTVTVTDANLCTAQTSVTVDEPMSGLSLDIAVTNVNCSGAFDLTVGGGTPVYTYDWSNDGAETPDNDAQDITVAAAGTYTVTVTDANGCTAEASAPYNGCDYGDLADNNTPGSYPTDATNGAGEGVGPSHHVVPGIKMGATVDAEAGGASSANANGDDTAGSDDENGVAAFPMFVAGQTVNVSVNVMNMNPDDEAAKLTAYFDWNADGDFNDAGEMVSASVPQGTNGNINLSVPVPIGTSLNTNLGARFRLSTDTDASMSPTGPAPDGEVEDYLIQVMAFDFGDLADNNAAGSYPTDATNGAGEGVGASHKIIAGLKIGAIVDPEAAGQPSGTANGDDSATNDDEDGVTLPMFLANQAYTVPVVVMNMTGVQAKLTGFFDWNANGSLSDAGEMVSVNVPTGTNGVVNLSVSVPIDAVLNTALGARFRLSTDATASMNPSGPAPDGEVEDYQVTAVMAFDYGDLPDGNVPGDYPTDGNNSNGEGVGPSHKIVAGLKLGNIVDIDNFGTPSPTATADDAPNYLGQDDEDGVILPVFVAGQTAVASVTAMNMTGTPATLYVYFDFNRDGDFADAGETFSVPVPNGTNGTFNVPVSVPVSAKLNTLLGIRFRLTNDPAFSGLATGPANSGEVEDYVALVLGDDYGDLPDTYGTSGPNAPRHTVTPELTLGGCVDNEAGGQPEPMAGAMTGGDDNTSGGTTIGTCAVGSDDENGIVFETPLMPGAEACIRVTATNTTGAPANLQAWIDFNGDGDLLDGGEALSLTGGGVIPNGGVNNQQYCFTVPAGATFQGGQAMVRFRLSSTGGLAPNNGAAANGEIEDYKVALAKIGTFVWEDTNGDGIQNEPGTNGINGASVQLVWAGPDNNLATNGDNITFGTTTSSMGGYNGQYMFLGLTSGTYRVGLPANPAGGFLPTATNQGGDDELDSDLASGETFVVPVNFNLPLSEDGVGDVPGGTNGFPDAQDNLTFDFGYYAPASIGNYTWIDTNGNGIQDPNEDPLPNVPVTLTGTTGSGVPVNQNTTTDGSGLYNFPNLAPGSYKLTFGTPAGSDYVSTDVNQGGNDASDSDADPAMAGMTVFEVLTSGENNTTYDAGFYIPAEIGNYTWIDENADGFQDPGEDPLPGVTVVLDGTTGTGEVVNLTAITDNNGNYTFTGLQPGSYKLTFVTPLGDYVSTLVNAPIANDANDSDADPNMGGMTVFEVLTSGESNLTYDAGYYEAASIGNFVWNDLDADGVQDSNEPGIGGVLVTLTGDDNQGNMIVLTTTTAPDGSYLFDGLVPGDYKLTFGTPSGFDFPSPVNAGGNDATDSDADPTMAGMTTYETLVSGEYNPTYDAGFYECPEITFKNLPVQPVCPGEDIAGIQIFTVPGAAVISWTGGAAIGLNNGTAPGPMAEIPAFIPTAEGTVTVTVTATLGQCTITETFTITVNDATPPVFANCPNNVTVNNDVDKCLAVVWWTPPSATDNCDGQVTVTQSGGFAPGSAFSVNTTTTITYTANDGNGNTATCVFTVSVVDMQLPTLECPAGAIVAVGTDAGICQAIINGTSLDAQVSDNCPGVELVNNINSTSSLGGGTGFNLGYHTIIWTATDAADNSRTCSFTLYVYDDEAPTVVSCPSNITVNNNIDVCGAVVNYPAPVFDDNCTNTTTVRTEGPASGSTFPIGVTTVTHVFSDGTADNNPATCSFTVTVIDNQVPEITCPNNITVNINNANGPISGGQAELISSGPCGVTLSYDAPEGTDNCPLAVTYLAGGQGSEPNYYEYGGYYTETWNIIDASGNIASCSFTITVLDAVPPVITCPTSITVGTDEIDGVCGATVTYSFPMGFDNCPGYAVAQNHGPTSGSIFNLGTTTVAYTVTDDAGNDTSCAFTVTVVDNDAPVISTCPNDRFVNTSTTPAYNCRGQVPNLVDEVVAEDNCTDVDDLTITQSPAAGTTFGNDHGDTRIVVITVTDAAGNSTTCEVVLTLRDNEAPSINCANVETNFAADAGLCSYRVLGTELDPTFVDNCDATLSNDYNGLPSMHNALLPLGATTVIWTVTDDNGNTASCAVVYTVTDEEDPMAMCIPNLTVVLNDNGFFDIPVTMVNAGSWDNCGPLVRKQVSLDNDVYGANVTVNCDDINLQSNQDVTVYLQVEDQSGNVSTCTTSVNVLDVDEPTLQCPGNVYTNTDAEVCTAVVNGIAPQNVDDNCPTVVTYALSGATTGSGISNASGTTFNLGTTVVEYVAADESGNISVCSFLVVVSDNEAPVSDYCPNDITAANDDDLCGAVVNYETPTFDDNCAGQNLEGTLVEGLASGSVFPVGTTTVVYQFTDGSGNSTTCSFDVTINDTQFPEITCPANISVNTLGEVVTGNPTMIATGPCGVNLAYTMPIGTDNCPLAETDLISGFGSGLNFYAYGGIYTSIYRVTDAAGNATTCSFTVQVDDAVPPTITCPVDITVNNDPGECNATVTYANPLGFDNCPGYEITINNGSLPSGSEFAVGEHTVSFTVTDDAGNSTACSFTVDVLDIESPEITTCPADRLVNTSTGTAGDCAGLVPDLTGELVAQDNCTDVDDLVITQSPIAGSTFNGGHGDELEVTMTVTDQYGNSNTCTVTLTLNDDEDPTINCDVPTALNNTTGLCGYQVSNNQLDPGFGDNCKANRQHNYLVAPQLYTLNGAFLPVGSTTVVWTITDEAGNTVTCEVTYVVTDAEPPVANCIASIDAVLDGDGLFEVTQAMIDLGSSDNCGITSIGISRDGESYGDSFLVSCSDEEDDVVATLRVVDVNGNVSICTTQVFVYDFNTPLLTCPNPVTVSTDPEVCTAVVDGIAPQFIDDNCPTTLTYAITGVTTGGGNGDASGNTFNKGVSTVTYTLTDDAGNVNVCFFDVVVEDNEAPVLDCENLGAQTRSTDNDECTYTAQGTEFDPAFVGDNCPGVVLTNSYDNSSSLEGSVFPKGTTTVIWTATDASGNITTCSLVVTVVDEQDPFISCPQNATFNNNAGQCSYTLLTNALNPAFGDNCPGASISHNYVTAPNPWTLAGANFPVGVTTIIWTVIDASGNAVTCSFTVTVLDAEAPVFVNCPTSMFMAGNDPDNCSAKVNWSIPIAEDNCSVTVVQTTGPVPGSDIPVGDHIITYKATDPAGNMATCTFLVRVIDTQNPEFDADIIMPNDTTVNCHQIPSNCVYHGPLICTPLTNNDVHDNCTVPEDLEVVFTEESTQCDDPSDCCFYNYDLTRTWTVTDEAGNQLIHVQEIEVQDTTRPVALCKNLTVTLDKTGKAFITPADINNGSYDNCAAPEYLTYTINPAGPFTCANLGDNVVTLTVTDPCGNFSTCQAIVTVLEGIAPCVPEYDVQTSCMDNATTLENGQFQDIITVKSLAMQTWTLTANNGGLFTNNSPAPPAAGVVIPVGTQFTAGTADGIDNDGDGQVDEADEMIYYTLRGRFTECVGYTISLSNSTNFGMGTQATTSTISNKACYPHPYFVNLDGPFCLNTTPFVIEVGEYNNAAGTVGGFMVNGVNTNIFDANALGEGFHTVMATFDAGTATQNLVINGVQVGGSMADALADPGCKQKITKLVQVVGTPTTVACNDLINISLDSSCVAVVFPDMVLEGTYYCFDDYTVTLNYPQGTTQFTPPNRVDATHINKTITYTLSHIISGNMCWGSVTVEDKLAPKLTCPADLTLACSESTDISHTGNVGIQDCSATTTQIDENIIDNGECGSPRQIITRTFIVTDAWSNQSLCTQTITVVPFDLADVVMPANITINCEVVNANPSATLPNNTGRPSINGAPIGTGGLCSASLGYTDVVLDICEGSFEIYRTWFVANTCLAPGDDNPITHLQRIRVNDIGGPVFNCPADVTVSVDPFTCCATAALPDVIISEGCSNITDLEAKVTGVDPNTGNITTFTVPGSLADFAGNNHWNPDTLAVFPFTQCLPNNNTYTVRYTAADQCGNTSSCDFSLTVMDLVPPAVSCDEFTQVSLGSDGRIIVNATTFDDGTYDNCCLDGFEVARMIDGPCDLDSIADEFAPTVEFCCADLGDTVTVVFRAYDCTGNTNDCMVQVFVDDKLKPVCNAPANVTVSCENFDPSLWAYGAATATDNCCMDTITTLVILTNFDTTCNKGTITRRFTAVDCAGQTSTCTQRIVVNYEQDYFVRFPNDQIVYECSGDGVYTVPTFFGEDCELLATSFHDQVFNIDPDACFKIERTWEVINWCTHNPNLPLVDVPNPNPNVNFNSPQNLPGPIVSAPGTTGPWAPTVIRINPSDPTTTNFSIFWDANANGYRYKQIIKVIDNEAPVVSNCPDTLVEVCDLTPNSNQFWNDMAWWDATHQLHDLCEAPTDLTITGTDSCTGASVSVRYLLFLDTDNDGDMETVISSTNLPATAGTVNVGNAANPNFAGGVTTSFDQRPVPSNQKYRFALQTAISGNSKVATLRWNTDQSPNTYVVPQLPYGTHKIKWIVEDGCGNEKVCEYEFVVKDCKAPTVVCINGLSANIMPTDMIVLWASDFLQYTEDNCTPTDQIKIGIRRKGAGTGFPTNPDGTPQTSVAFTCADLGTQFVELWGQDAAGNADYCETYVIVQDNAGNCSNSNVTVAGELKTETQEGLQDAEVELNGMHPALPPINMFELSEINGSYMFGNAMPAAANYTVTPTKDDDHLNGVTTYDLVLINKHILGIESFDSPYKIIASDANNSKSVTTFDIAEIRKLILGIYTELPNNTSWRFVDESYTFPNPDNPFAPAFPESKSVADIQNNALNDDFVSVKVGDVNNTMIANNLMSTDDRTSSTMLFDVKDRSVARGEAIDVHFKADQFAQGYQFTLNLKGLEVLDIVPGEGMSNANFAVFSEVLTTSFDAAPGMSAPAEFTLRLRAKTDGSLSNMMNVSSSVTKAEAYGKDAERQSVALRFNGKEVRGVGFEVYQNQPNPWISRTVIGFHLPEADDVTLTVFDETGRMLYRQVGDFGKGHNAFTLDKELVNTTGVLYYQVSTSEESVTMKMIQTK